jgi:16S rRNA (cytidine1402-2'-O)-methyltransferase
MTPRAIETLKAVDVIACEDTRVSGRFVRGFGIDTPLISYHEFNERTRAGHLVRAMQEGKSVAVISDAGSPGISDPAYRVVRAALDHDVPIVALPGPTALIPALTASGLPTDRFLFEGFLSHRSAARRRRLETLREFPHTIVVYESVHRIAKTLGDMHDILGDRTVCVAREISKKFEEYWRGTLAEAVIWAAGKTMRGEFAIVVAGYHNQPYSDEHDNNNPPHLSL